MSNTLDSYVTLGRSGLRVSPLTLGTMSFGEDWGRGADPRTCHTMLSAYVDAGGNSVDTANSYTNGHSERIIGDWLSAAPARRDRLVVGTKFFCNLHPGDPNGGGAGRKSLLDQLHQSLRRLRTDYVDLLWLHGWDPFTPLEETMCSLDDVVRAGKVRYIGFSNTPAWIASEAQTLARLRGRPTVVAFQLEYSLLERTVEGAHLPMCEAHGMGVMPWSPLKNGLLSGTYRRDGSSSTRGGRAAVDALSDADRAVVEEVHAVAEDVGVSPAAVALAWVRSRPEVTSTLIGARTPEQLRSNLASLTVELSDEHLARLDAVSRPAPVYPNGYEASTRIMQFPGTTVDGIAYPPNPALDSATARY
ncbi:aldo/keto reductase [Streptomyces sp. NPDC026672]|uniref:aldo/keto reductase n=1 Tax=unclassified Streptomyces TaxID=2593676 RepID=UPI0033CEBB9A